MKASSTRENLHIPAATVPAMFFKDCTETFPNDVCTLLPLILCMRISSGWKIRNDLFPRFMSYVSTRTLHFVSAILKSHTDRLSKGCFGKFLVFKIRRLNPDLKCLPGILYLDKFSFETTFRKQSKSGRFKTLLWIRYLIVFNMQYCSSQRPPSQKVCTK